MSRPTAGLHPGVYARYPGCPKHDAPRPPFFRGGVQVDRVAVYYLKSSQVRECLMRASRTKGCTATVLDSELTRHRDQH